MTECFICETHISGQLLYRPCLCDLRVHDHCMQGVVTRVPSHATECAVCRQPYSVRQDEQRECIVDPNHQYTVVLYIFLGVCATFACLLLPNPYSLDPTCTIGIVCVSSFAILIIMSITMVLVLWIHCHMYYTTGRCCVCRRVVTTTTRGIVLTNGTQHV